MYHSPAQQPLQGPGLTLGRACRSPRATEQMASSGLEEEVPSRPQGDQLSLETPSPQSCDISKGEKGYDSSALWVGVGPAEERGYIRQPE